MFAAVWSHSAAPPRQGTRGRTPIAISIAVSTALHLAALVAFDFALPVAPRNERPAPLTVVLGVPRTADQSAGRAVDHAAGYERDAAAEKPAAAPFAGPPGRMPAPPGPGGRRPGLPQPDAFESNRAAAFLADRTTGGWLDMPPPSAPVVEIVAVRPVIAAPEAPARTAAFTAEQERMLARRLADWAESYAGRYEAGDEAVWKYEGQRYTARFIPLPGGDDTGLARVAVRVTTEQGGDRLSTDIRLKQLAFSSFAQFVDRWDDSVQIHDDELDGRFHSNSEINLSYSRKVAPRFHDKVTTSARTVNVTDRRGHRRRDEIFLGGLETGVTSIRLPKHYVPLPATIRIREEQVHEFAEDTRIRFHADGSYSWVYLDSGLFERRGTIEKPASYLVAKNEAELHLTGIVAGKVLVFSPNRIVIIDDLVYATDPEAPEGGDNYLGIVSERSVEIADPESTGPGDLHIQAAIYAKRQFRVRAYGHRNGHRRGDTLEIYGSLTAGSLTATEPRYATRIRFDPRLESRRPPGFPVTDRYELESWDAAWTVQP